MRKIVMMLLILAMTVCGVIGIAACGKDPEPEQNQGQVEQEKDKDKEEEKNPGQSQGGEKEDEGKGDEENENPNTKPGETNPPETPENQKPNPENPPEEDPKEDDKQDEEDKKDEDKKEEPPQDEPQGDEPEKDPDEEETDPTPDNPTKPDDKPEEKPEDKEPEEKPEEKPDDTKPEEKPQDPPKEEECQHNYVYQAYGDDRNTRYHYQVCSICGNKTTAVRCSFGESKHVPATCTEDGYNLYTCEVCNIEFKSYPMNYLGRTEKATGHNYEGQDWEHVDGASHTVNTTVSQHQKHCTKCDFVLTEECHFSDEIKQPTCEEAGEDNSTCTECGYKTSTTLEKLEHTFTYTYNGNETHTVRCTRACCASKTFDSQKCDFEEESRSGGDCTQGTITYRCKVCNGTKTEKTGGHVYTTSNFCDNCHKDGLKCENEVNVGSWKLPSIVRNDELKNVEKIYIGEKCNGTKVYGIAKGAFSDFSQLKEVFIPKDVRAISSDAFENSGLTTIYFEGSEKTWNTVGTDGNWSTYFKDKNKKENVQVQCDQNTEDIKKDWNIKSKSNTATVAALPAGDNKRLYA